jgi:hypothetical protein
MKNLTVIEDQWAYLASLQKITRERVEALVNEAETQGRVLGVRLDIADEENPTPWKPMSSRSLKIPPEELPKEITLIVANEIFIEKQRLTTEPLKSLYPNSCFSKPGFLQSTSHATANLWYSEDYRVCL